MLWDQDSFLLFFFSLTLCNSLADNTRTCNTVWLGVFRTTAARSEWLIHSLLRWVCRVTLSSLFTIDWLNVLNFQIDVNTLLLSLTLKILCIRYFFFRSLKVLLPHNITQKTCFETVIFLGSTFLLSFLNTFCYDYIKDCFYVFMNHNWNNFFFLLNCI